MSYTGHMDLASLSVAHERDPEDMEVLHHYHEALCRILGCLPYMGSSLGVITENAELGSYCHRGCPICLRCRRVTCEHEANFPPQPPNPHPGWTFPGRGSKVAVRCRSCDYDLQGVGLTYRGELAFCDFTCADEWAERKLTVDEIVEPKW